MRRRVGIAALSLVLPGVLAAQQDLRGVPLHIPLNPMSVSRTPLAAQPYLVAADRWVHTLSIDYGSAVEWEESEQGGRYVLDAELLRVHLELRKDLSSGSFFQVALDVNSALNGFADAAFDWYHGVVGVPMRGREQRPLNEYLYELRIPGGVILRPERPDYFVGDARLAYGVRHSGRSQTTLLATLPTSNAPEGFSRRALGVGVVHTRRSDPDRKLAFQGTVGVGHTPTQGTLSEHQQEFMASASLAVNLRVAPTTSFYGYLYTHTGKYHSTTLPELHSQELTADIGLQRLTRGGHLWRLGVTEDFGPSDAGLDLILRFGVSW